VGAGIEGVGLCRSSAGQDGGRGHEYCENGNRESHDEESGNIAVIGYVGRNNVVFEGDNAQEKVVGSASYVSASKT
jgi:hypothetical protein